jgi:SAM-dependent methyltransferase
MSTTDTQSAKDQEHATWASVVEGWRVHDARLRSCSRIVTERMLTVACVGPGDRVLDIATGTGEPAIPAAEQVGPSGIVLGTDFVEGMLAVARDKAAERGLTNVEFRRVDGEELDVPAGSYDAVLVRWGLMYMPDPLACLRNARRALRAGGRIAVACWSEPARNPWAILPLRVLARHTTVPTPPPGGPGHFTFADPSKLRATLDAAGFCDLALDEVAVVDGGEFDDGVDYLTYARAVRAPVAHAYDALPPETQRDVDRDVAAAAERFRVGSSVQLPGVTWVAGARR